MSIQAEVRPSRGRALFVAGAVLLLIALAGIVVYATGLPDLASVEASAVGALRGLTVVGAAVCGGLGALLLVLAAVKRRSAAADRRRGAREAS